MIRQPIYYMRNTALYCVFCKDVREQGYTAVFEQPHESLSCDICMQPLFDADKKGLEDLVKLVSLI